MDFETILSENYEYYCKEFEGYSRSKIYRYLLKDFKLIFKAIRNIEFSSLRNEKNLRKDIYVIENELINDESPYAILLSTGNRKPVWYAYYIMAYAEENAIASEYALLMQAFKNGVQEGYKRESSLEDLISFCALLGVGWDTLESDLNQFDAYFAHYEEALLGKITPSVRHIYTVYELKKFYMRELASSETFSYPEFQRVLFRRG